jgi:hypothetical protein
MKCSICGHDRPDEVAPAWGLPWFGPLCANCWSLHTDLNEAAARGDWASFSRLATKAAVAAGVPA